mmetsp:Transcript_160292/g.307582  ORF Transcript_160292/g.307582 Transcript_160292/m.307582 type:complete len:189 (+) Transcript_160292:108-674(+)
MNSMRHYALLLVNFAFVASSASAELCQAAETKHQLLLKELEAVQEAAKADLEDANAKLSRLSKLVAEKKQIIEYDVADTKAASLVRGMELAQYNELLKHQNVSAPVEKKEMLSRQAYESLLANITSEYRESLSQRDEALVMMGRLQQKKEDSEAVLREITVKQQAANTRLRELRSDCKGHVSSFMQVV